MPYFLDKCTTAAELRNCENVRELAAKVNVRVSSDGCATQKVRAVGSGFNSVEPGVAGDVKGSLAS